MDAAVEAAARGRKMSTPLDFIVGVEGAGGRGMGRVEDRVD